MKISLQGAVDLHVHSYPCLFPRIGDDLDLATQARQAGMRAISLKCHHESTTSRAYLLRKLVPDIELFGGVVLNNYVGGFNPAAVEACLKAGGKAIWMPTIDAWNHVAAYGRPGYAGPLGGGALEGLKALGEDGRLLPALYEILELIAKHDGLLCTGHLSVPEVTTLVREARNRGVKKILLSHPLAPSIRMDQETLRLLIRLGAKAEFAYSTLSPQRGDLALAAVKEAIDAIGAANAVLTSGAGQLHNPYPVEALRVLAQGLREAGVSEDDIYTMLCTTPTELLGLLTLPRFHAEDDVRPFSASD